MKSINSRSALRLTRAAAALWGLLLAAVMTTLVLGPVSSASAVTLDPTAPVRVLTSATGQSLPLLAATRYAGTENRFAFATPPVHVDPLTSFGGAQSVTVAWELQRANTGTNMQWQKVQWLSNSAALYGVVLDPNDEDGTTYLHPTLTAGVDVAGVSFSSRAVTTKSEAYRVVATVTWSSRDSGAVLKTTTFTPTVVGDLACRGTTEAHCQVIKNPFASVGSFISIAP